MPCVGSWLSQKTLSSSSYVIAVRSNTTRTASVWLVMPLHTSSYVGFFVSPPAYPTAVEYTPGSSQNLRSAPQKQPMPNCASCRPAGNGALSGCPFRKWRSGTGIGLARPGSTLSAGSSLVAFFMNENMKILRGSLEYHHENLHLRRRRGGRAHRRLAFARRARHIGRSARRPRESHPPQRPSHPLTR